MVMEITNSDSDGNRKCILIQLFCLPSKRIVVVENEITSIPLDCLVAKLQETEIQQ